MEIAQGMSKNICKQHCNTRKEKGRKKQESQNPLKKAYRKISIRNSRIAFHQLFLVILSSWLHQKVRAARVQNETAPEKFLN